MSYVKDKGMIEYVLHSCAPVISLDTLYSMSAACTVYLSVTCMLLWVRASMPACLPTCTVLTFKDEGQSTAVSMNSTLSSLCA